MSIRNLRHDSPCGRMRAVSGPADIGGLAFSDARLSRSFQWTGRSNPRGVALPAAVKIRLAPRDAGSIILTRSYIKLKVVGVTSQRETENAVRSEPRRRKALRRRVS